MMTCSHARFKPNAAIAIPPTIKPMTTVNNTYNILSYWADIFQVLVWVLMDIISDYYGISIEFTK